ncbi:MAG TPA: DUF1700 domain-containing protein [Mobilitalea sp.]|nr:DUF1700 domain-containing protein [Mobilitalea sp.]
MTRLEFMKELESLLPDIPLEEREEALQYYNGYFDDAGEDHEDEIIKELGSPSKVASIIKADLNSNAADRESRGYFTEKGYHDTIYNEEKYEIVGAANKDSGSSEQTDSTKDTNSTNDTYGNNSNDANYSNGANQTNQSYQTKNAYNANGASQSNGTGYSNGTAGQRAYSSTQQNKSSNSALFLIIGIFTFPIWFPLLMTALGIAIGIIAAILGIIFGFGVAGITMMGVGIALFVAGLVQITAPLIGLLFIGCGLLVLGLGMLFTLACVMLCKTVLPAFIKGILELCRLPFKNRSVMA